MKLSRRTLLASALGFVATFSEGCATQGSTTLKPASSKASFEDFLAQRGLTVSGLTVPQLVDSSLSFYRSVRATGLANDPQADMLLVQWGVFDWGHGEHFEFDMTRQFIASGALDDDAISQLACTASFKPTAELRSITMANRWCRSRAEVDSFAAFIHESAAYRAVSSVMPDKVSLRWGKAG